MSRTERHYGRHMEDKQKICDAFCTALQETDIGRYITKIDYTSYISGTESVRIGHSSGMETTLDVTGEAGDQMMRNILDHMHFL